MSFDPIPRLSTVIANNLAVLLKISPHDIDNSIIDNIKSYNNPHELEEFLSAFTSEVNSQSIRSIIEALFSSKSQLRKSDADNPLFDKSESEIEYGEKGKEAQSSPDSSSRNQSAKFPGKQNKKKNIKSNQLVTDREKRKNGGKSEAKSNQVQRRGRFAPRPETRHRRFCLCNAQGSEHKLIGNCLECGKIVCSEEGEGPCLYCGNEIALLGSIHPSVIVDDYDELEHDEDLNERNNDGLMNRRNQKGNQNEDEKLHQALDLRNRLLEFERTSAQRTRVYDDSTDWFSESTNIWLSHSDRERASVMAEDIEKKKRDAKKTRYLTLDFKSGQVIEKTIGIPDDSLDAVDSFLSQARERELRRFENLETSYEIDMFGRRVDHRDRMPKPQMNNDESNPLGPNPFLSGDGKDLYETLRERIQLSTMTQAERRQAAASQWGKKQRQFNGEAIASSHVDLIKTQDSSGAVKHRWRIIRTEEGNEDFINDLDLCKNDGIMDSMEDGSNTYDDRVYETAMESPWNDASDHGICLSLHQPWASLIIYGFKKAEGRNWNTEYRGRLWIHAASKDPDPVDIEGLEGYYRDLYETGTSLVEQKSENAKLKKSTTICLPFPSEYPTSCLLGCVDLVDCMTQMDYMHFRETQPGGVLRTEENASPFIFICQKPRRLLLPIQMKGEQKLWHLPLNRLHQFQRSLKPVLCPLRLTSPQYPVMIDSSVPQSTDQRHFSILSESISARNLRSIKNLVRCIGTLTSDLFKDAKKHVQIDRHQDGVLVTIRKFWSSLLQQATVLGIRELELESKWAQHEDSVLKESSDLNHVGFWTIFSNHNSSNLLFYYKLICEAVNNQLMKTPIDYSLQFPIGDASQYSALFVDDECLKSGSIPISLQSRTEQRDDQTAIGFPTVLICIGKSIELMWNTTQSKIESALQDNNAKEINVTLNSGDALLIQRDNIRSEVCLLDQFNLSPVKTAVVQSPQMHNPSVQSGSSPALALSDTLSIGSSTVFSLMKSGTLLLILDR